MAAVKRELPLLTAEEFAQLPDSGMVEELVRGRIVSSPLPGFRHGVVCVRVASSFAGFSDEHDLGHVLSNNSGVITARDPDSVRGPDLSFYSYVRMPKAEVPIGYAAISPELVCEVLSPGDRCADVLEKVAEYLNAGILTVVVLEPDERAAHVFEADRPPATLGPEDVLRLERILPGFEVVVGRLFG